MWPKSLPPDWLSRRSSMAELSLRNSRKQFQIDGACSMPQHRGSGDNHCFLQISEFFATRWKWSWWRGSYLWQHLEPNQMSEVAVDKQMSSFSRWFLKENCKGRPNSINRNPNSCPWKLEPRRWDCIHSPNQVSWAHFLLVWMVCIPLPFCTNWLLYVCITKRNYHFIFPVVTLQKSIMQHLGTNHEEKKTYVLILPRTDQNLLDSK